MHYVALVILLQSAIFVHVNSKECYVCTNVPNIQECTNTVRCADGQSCFDNVTITGQQRLHNLGCVENGNCMLHNPGESVIIGRNLDKRQTQNCLECCSTDLCNINLCNHTKPTDCSDDASIDCARLSNLINVCIDIHKAKLICRKFCGLCDLVDGNWGPWTHWSNCDVTCENGTQTRRRSCSNPPPAHGGLDCEGQSLESKLCQQPLCPVDGNWGEWTNWSTCDVTCDNGTQSKTRSCSNPPPSNGGLDCPGQSLDTEVCQKQTCPVDGNWGDWADWSTCDVTCENGSQTRTRSCSSPSPLNGGFDCQGDHLESTLCQKPLCPVHGGWSGWSSWGTCSVSCGVGQQERSRNCSNPAPSRFGDHCFGQNWDSKICFPDYCAAEGRWNQWSDWGMCSTSCGTGLQKRFRNCSFPAPGNFGGHCLGENSDTQLCVIHSCSDGGWSDWTLWSRCNLLVDDVGIRSRYRECNNPPPSPFGKTCSGIPVETSRCNAPYDCSSVLEESPESSSGIYTVMLWKSKRNINVFCDMDTDSGGWTVFQRRTNKILLFTRTFNEYVNGFGDLSGEFWLGLKYIQEMASRAQSELRIEVTANVTSGYEAFHNFSLSPSPDYTLHISQWSGNIGNNTHGLRDHDNMQFTTIDRDRDTFNENCDKYWHGGWWYKDCLYVNLNSDQGPDHSRGPFHYVFTNNSFVGLSSTKIMFRVL